MMSVVVIWCLPRDILHSVYGEWLGWKDLSRLDLACVEKKEREEWLTSIAALRISQTFPYLSNNNLKTFYEWLCCRQVFYVEGFPIRLDVLEDLVTELNMKSYCPLIQSIIIRRRNSNEHSSDIRNLKRNLSVFLSYFHNLEGVTLCMSDLDSEAVLSVLVEKLRENSLVSISLQDINVRNNKYKVMIEKFFKKHACSLRHLNISTLDEVNMNCIASILIENKICMKKFTIHLGRQSLRVIPSLITYLSSSGGSLENLIVTGEEKSFDAEDLVTLVAASCPKLTCLVISGCNPCSMETLRRLYEQCPYLMDVSIGNDHNVIKTNEKTQFLSIEVKGHNEDWVICLSHALKRRKYKQVTLRLREDNYCPVSNLKSMLEPYQIKLDASTTSETSLISLLQNLPHLNCLHLHPLHEIHYTDAVLAAISEHVNALTALSLASIFYDKQLSKLIKACQLLERLTVNLCGWESLEAISKLSNLKMVYLTMAEHIAEETLDGLLLDEKVEWCTAMKRGYIMSISADAYYKFDNTPHCWVKDCK